MKKLNDLFQELGISKVRLAKYLGVSRQMVYNYLELDDINKWPKEKKILLYKLLDIEDGESISDIHITTDYLIEDNHPLELSVRDINDREYQILLQLINYFNDINNKEKYE